jgi:hypothetical protein
VKLLLPYLLTFFLANSLAVSNSVLQYDDSTKTPFSKYDSLKYSFLPKYEVYGKYFNPFEIENNSYYFDFGFKWHRKKSRYFATYLMAIGRGPQHYYKILSLSQLFRLTPKFDWIHLELSYGLAVVHSFDDKGLYTENGVGLGAILRSELQFDVGPRSNISLSYYISPMVCYNFREQVLPWYEPTNGVSTPVYPSLLNVGFNFYIA